MTLADEPPVTEDCCSTFAAIDYNGLESLVPAKSGLWHHREYAEGTWSDKGSSPDFSCFRASDVHHLKAPMDKENNDQSYRIQERAAQRYLSTANNQALAVALDEVGRHLQQAPALALGGLKGGA